VTRRTFTASVGQVATTQAGSHVLSLAAA